MHALERVTCIFCDPDPSGVLLQDKHGYVRFDGYPVTPGHVLVIPRRHISSLFDLTDDEARGLWHLVNEAKEALDARYHPDGYNVGVNVGEAAGQTIGHLHFHVIPRYRGDMEDPRGGVRGVIPEKQRY